MKRYVKECNNNLINIYIYIYIYISKRIQGLLSQSKKNVSKGKKRKKIQNVLTTSLINKNTPPIKKSYTNSPPKYMITLISKTTSPFSHE